MTKTKTIYLTGQNNFGNRGCEALVRSTVTVLTEVLGPIKVLVPSLDPVRDQAQWPDSAASGVSFVKAYPMTKMYSKWAGASQRWPWLHALARPKPSLQPELLEDLKRSDILLSIGGDNYSLDYGLASLYYFVGVAEAAMSMGKPAVLWGASVGPFSKQPIAERRMAEHLRKLTLVTVRESRSVEYLKGIGVNDNVVPVIDSAFAMTPEAVDTSAWWPKAPGDGVLGLNIGALIDDMRRQSGNPDGAVGAAAEFVRKILAETNLSVLLVPHVASLSGAKWNNDEDFNARLLDALGGAQARLSSVPSGFNAAQLKHVISQCRFLIAGRTHATVAAFSTGVPTISIAYSVKAKGINRDLFGHENYVLETPKLSFETLWAAYQTLLSDEAKLLDHYAKSLSSWRQRARLGAQKLYSLLDK
ncbi:polysaccharide pyruvyl transferase family protein [Roseateles toxinivorans]|uniref:Polysaccharide pyruvyl transferase WcaK-like protein n=1 Tax=Roseateles toxinivorans TaxID=270368 RepID=A0A4R6QKA1_9BURK|nr:polysaccharide pyruvyl transferase family protein [Roseateles toxinivorans]TDP63343.1 polysaccharide pyruvyl transferase WcaK-like protein [Roseateles toxinivorans]